MQGDTVAGWHTSPAADLQEVAAAAEHALALTGSWFVDQQHPSGYWCGELEGDTILESEYVLLLAWLGRSSADEVQAATNYISAQQLPDGGWSLFPGGDLDVSVSVKAYWALKIAGADPDSERLRRARQAIRAAGGADAVNSFTRFYLALLGQIPFDLCPAVPPEMMLLPNRGPLNIYRMSAWSRTIFVPLSIVWALRPIHELPAKHRIDELFICEPPDWPQLTAPGTTEDDRWLSWRKFFRVVDSTCKLAERWHLRPVRRRALQLAEAWMLERFSNSDGLGAIFPPIVWSTIALRALGYEEDSPEVRECLQQLESLGIAECETLRLQPCKSPVWDTAISLRALAAAKDTPREVLERAVEWLLAKEVRQQGDWSFRVDAEPGGWFFEHRNAFYPDIDDTIMVMMALREAEHDSSHSESALQRALAWVLAMQNRDGGWGAFDKDNDMDLLCEVPFADHNAMIDPSTPDITARVLEALAAFNFRVGDHVVDRAVSYLRRQQEPDGSWIGRWGVNYIYGTWQVVSGLSRVGLPIADPVLQRGADWLAEHQQDCGGWGESARTYEEPAERGRGPVTASQTAWALLGLLDAGYARDSVVERGIRFLVERQQPDGTWHESQFTGTGFPRVFYLRYHLYPIYFPMLALARWRSALAPNSGG